MPKCKLFARHLVFFINVLCNNAELADADKHKHRHVYGERVSVVNKGAVAGYVRGQSVIVGGGVDRGYANRIGFRRSASFHAAELFEELAGMGTGTTL